MSVKEAALLSIEAMNFEGEIETRVSDQIAAGATYDQNGAKFKPKTLFTRWTANTAKGGDPLEVTATYNVASNTAEVDVEYEKSGSTFTGNASLDATPTPRELGAASWRAFAATTQQRAGTQRIMETSCGCVPGRGHDKPSPSWAKK